MTAIRCTRVSDPVPMGWGDHIRHQHYQTSETGTVGFNHSRARAVAANMRSRAFDLLFRPFTHDQYLASAVVQRFVPGPTWSYVPPRDRPVTRG